MHVISFNILTVANKENARDPDSVPARDEIEHLLDDNEDMSNLYLTRKWIQNQQLEALSRGAASNSISTISPRLPRLSSNRSASLVREYIDDTEDYVNIQLDNQRNELIQLQLTLTIASFAIAVETLVAGWFGMNIPFTWNKKHGIFEIFVGGITVWCGQIFLLILAYARWKKLLGS
ncbi:hypothetical protein J1N35_042138 [Gossypium stocksii]|uniref:Magnesium transporter n=1 Tax=Gossypium stocksii TaxID=47602 RepID=A0A9D3UGV0_9ROSI|nr:hypothetical protein J1N35_042138 [Gossypium stocksii]